MRKRTYRILDFIVSNVNWSTNFVEYGRFANERKEILKQADDDELKLGSEDECRSWLSRESREQERRLNKWDSKHEGGFINDVIWMLEYHQNGLMQLIMYSVHLFLLALQVFTCFLYSSLPTTEDPVTNEYINPWLRYADHFAATDFIHKFDPKGHFNRMLGFLACQCLILRLRAFFSRLKTAKTNRYQLIDINIVDIEFGYASEIRQDFLVSIWAGVKALIHHDCFVRSSLCGRNREETLEFNRRVRCLSKVDRIYYYNQIDFNKCHEHLIMFRDYHQLANGIDQNRSRCRSNKHRTGLARTTFLFSINLPNKVRYVAQPAHRLDLAPYGSLLYGLFLISEVLSVITALTICFGMSYLAFISWNRVSILGLVCCLLRTSFTLVLIILNVYDCGLLVLCSTLFLSRSRKIVILLENEIEKYRYHLRQISMVDYHDQLLVHFKREVLNLPSIPTGFKRRFEDLERPFIGEKSSVRNGATRFSFLRKHNSTEFVNPSNHQAHIDDLIEIYRRELKRSGIARFNENISYLLNLIEVLQIELSDHKRFFTLLLDVNVIFGTLGCSLSIGALVEISNRSGAFVAVVACLTFLLPMICSLGVGASSESALISIYRCLRPFLADELRFLNPENSGRLFKMCDNLVESENRSFIILGNFPLSFSSLASILVWVITCTLVLQLFL